MRSKILEVKRLALVLTMLLFASTSVSAVSDSDMCFKQPVDQCQGNQFVELGNTDADTHDAEDKIEKAENTADLL